MFNFDENYWSISVDRDIPASAVKVWEQMILPGGAVFWHPFVKEHTAESWDGPGSKDRVIYNSGATFDREVVEWINGVGFDLKITQKGKNEILVVWRITKLNDDNCNLKITAYINSIKKLPFPLRWAIYKFKIKPLFSEYLKFALQGFSHYASTGEQVMRNQFGSHSLFSPQ
jgi:hypothetical protein